MKSWMLLMSVLMQGVQAHAGTLYPYVLRGSLEEPPREVMIEVKDDGTTVLHDAEAELRERLARKQDIQREIAAAENGLRLIEMMPPELAPMLVLLVPTLPHFSAGTPDDVAAILAHLADRVETLHDLAIRYKGNPRAQAAIAELLADCSRDADFVRSGASSETGEAIKARKKAVITMWLEILKEENNR